MTESLTYPMSVDLRLWKEDFQQKGLILFFAIKKLSFSYYSWLTYYISYYFGNIAYPIIYAIIIFTYRKGKFYFINNYSLS